MPRRQFVVEIKSTRRQAKGSARSLWGSTDLKALAREVQDEASHLFSADTPSDDLDERSAASITPALTLPEAKTFDRHLAPPATLDAIEPIWVGQQDTATVPVDDPQGNEPTRDEAELASPVEASNRRADTSESISNSHKKSRANLLRPHDVNKAMDELVLLEAENRRLKILLAARLRQENLALAKMLRRFDIS